MLGYHSSPVRWCEVPYTHSTHIVEWYNTLSNASFVAVALWLRTQFRCGNLPPALPALFLLLGLCSAWFHGTLSLAGQLADEFLIIWIALLSIGHFAQLPPGAVGFCTVAAVLALGMFPSLNHKLLIAGMLALMALLDLAVGTTQPHQVWAAWRRSLRWLGLSLAAWVLDLQLCRPGGQQLHFHAWWHILVAVASVHLAAVGCCVLGRHPCRLAYRCGGLLLATESAA